MTPLVAKASYARQIAASGDVVTIRRSIPSPFTSAPIRARLTGYTPEELTGNMQESDRKAIVLADDVAACGLDLPIKAKQDRLVLGDRVMVIQAVDDTSRRVGGELIAYELRVSG